MTAISTLISRRGISFATDSFLTVYKKDTDTHEIVEFKKPKIIRAEKYHAAIAYYGFAKYGDWCIYDWIKKKISEYDKSLSLEEFANILKKDLDKALDNFFSKYNINRGIGLHLAGYETKCNLLLPELYHICNYTDPSYSKIGDLYVGPQLYGTLPDDYKSVDDITIEQKKQKINKFLETGRMFIFNNGDPEMYNPLSKAFFDSFTTLQNRDRTDSFDLKAQCAFTRKPIEMIKSAQKDFCKKGKVTIGGKIHDLTIDKNKNYK